MAFGMALDPNHRPTSPPLLHGLHGNHSYELQPPVQRPHDNHDHDTVSRTINFVFLECLTRPPRNTLDERDIS